jgi:hypothetical protein
MRKNKQMTIPKTNKFLKTYNGTIQQTTGVSPAQVQDNKRFVVQYIVDSINKQNKIENTTHDYKLHANDQVTLIELKKTLKKIKYNAGPYYYVITEFQTNQLQLSSMMALLKQ